MKKISPRNIFLVNNQIRDLKLIDFGLARAAASDTDSTCIGTGTPGYTAPEQMGSQGQVHITTAADYYSLGACLFRSLTGSTPKDSAENERLMLGIDQKLKYIVNICLNVDPKQRPNAARIRELLAELDPNRSSIQKNSPKPSPLRLFKVATLGIIIFIGSGVILASTNPELTRTILNNLGMIGLETRANVLPSQPAVTAKSVPDVVVTPRKLDPKPKNPVSEQQASSLSTARDDVAKETHAVATPNKRVIPKKPQVLDLTAEERLFQTQIDALQLTVGINGNALHTLAQVLNRMGPDARATWHGKEMDKNMLDNDGRQRIAAAYFGLIQTALTKCETEIAKTYLNIAKNLVGSENSSWQSMNNQVEKGMFWGPDGQLRTCSG
ncbi:hypothetical protein TI04_10990 [Achromatium sp. WMS2]|nr:hypothetical protein TI04_10990 [Achromatium sp. WMS2]